jgi:PAS domain S-box-containing protein
MTDRVHAEEALREERQFSEQILESAGEGIVVLDQDLRYVLLNRFMEELTGMWRQEVVGRTPADLFPGIRDAVHQAVEDALEGSRPYDIEHRIHRPDGSIGRGRACASPCGSAGPFGA